jgi:putative heme-binding domain-containing protein
LERFLPAKLRRKRLGDNIDARAILARQGDAQRGRELFLSGQVGQCITCHRLQGSGRSVGPDLDAIASKRTRQQLLESVLSPSKTIEPQYSTHLALTDDGTIVTGLKILETSAVVVIRTPDGKDVRLQKVDVDTLRAQPQSLMPSGLAAEMTAQELSDLLAFLCSLK